MLIANIAVPVLFPQPALMIAALLPVVVVEALILRRPFSFRFRDILAANAFSTLLGLPVAYIALAVFGVLHTRGESPWAAAGFSSRVVTSDGDHWWILPLALAAVLIPCFVGSVLIESRYLARATGLTARGPLVRAVTRANVYSYLVLLGFDFVWFSFRIQ